MFCGFREIFFRNKHKKYVQINVKIQVVIIIDSLLEEVFSIVTTDIQTIFVRVNITRTIIIGAIRYPNAFFLISITAEININGR